MHNFVLHEPYSESGIQVSEFTAPNLNMGQPEGGIDAPACPCHHVCRVDVMAGVQEKLPLDEMARLFTAHGVVKALLFGAFARGTATRRSDVDLLVIQPTTRRFFDRYEGLYSEICRLIKGRAVDLLIYTPEELEAISHRKFIQTILHEGVTIYEQRKVMA